MKVVHARRMNLSSLALLAALTPLTLSTVGCRQDMHDAPKIEPLEASAFFADDQGSRPLVEGTVARGELQEDDLLYRGLGTDGKPSETFPFPVSAQVMERGQREFNIFCSPCHDRAGTGNGMVAQRGFKHPPSYTDERLLKEPPGYFVSVMVNGFGQMSSYASQVKPRDRWAIAAYIRALQLSQSGHLADLTPAERARFQGGPGNRNESDQNSSTGERNEAE